MWQVKEMDVVLDDWLTLGLVFVSSQVYCVMFNRRYGCCRALEVLYRMVANGAFFDDGFGV